MPVSLLGTLRREGAGDEKGSPTLSDLVRQDWRTAGEQAPLSYEEGPRHIIPPFWRCVLHSVPLASA